MYLGQINVHNYHTYGLTTYGLTVSKGLSIL